MPLKQEMLCRLAVDENGWVTARPAVPSTSSIPPARMKYELLLKRVHFRGWPSDFNQTAIELGVTAHRSSLSSEGKCNDKAVFLTDFP